MFATKNMMKNKIKKEMGMPEHLTTDMGGGKDEVVIPKPKIIQNATGLINDDLLINNQVYSNYHKQ